MKNPELIDYIEHHLHRDVGADQIRQTLLDAGHDRIDIEINMKHAMKRHKNHRRVLGVIIILIIGLGLLFLFSSVRNVSSTVYLPDSFVSDSGIVNNDEFMFTEQGSLTIDHVFLPGRIEILGRGTYCDKNHVEGRMHNGKLYMINTVKQTYEMINGNLVIRDRTEEELAESVIKAWPNYKIYAGNRMIGQGYFTDVQEIHAYNVSGRIRIEYLGDCAPADWSGDHKRLYISKITYSE